MDLDSVIDELYGLDPSQFTSRRDELASEARQSGERELAAAVKVLRRPSAAAYTVNLMARSRADEIGRLMELGARMREAQAALSGEELRALGRQRSQLVAGLAQEARRTAREAGHPISEAIEREVQATFEAALADETAGEAVRAGRLVRGLEHRGMDAVDLEGAVAGTGTRAGPTPAPSKREAAERPSDHDKGGRQAAQQAAEAQAAEERAAERARQKARAVEAAEQAEETARRAEERRTGAAEALDRARGIRRGAEEEVHRLQAELAVAREELDRATDGERRARSALAEVEDEAEAAASVARRARAGADAL